MSSFSFSKISTFFQCPYKYKLKYLDKVDIPFETNIALEKGKIIHALIEGFFKDEVIPFNYELSTKEDLERYYKIFEEFKNEEFIKKLTKIKLIEVEKGFSLYLKGKELKAKAEYDDNALIRGYIDFFGIIQKENKNIAIIIDWKTGNPPKEPNVLQVKIYSLWAFLNYPALDEIKTCFYYVEHNIKKCYTFKRSELNTLKEEVLEKIKYIENEKEFRKNYSPLCDYCEMKKFGYCDGEMPKAYYF